MDDSEGFDVRSQYTAYFPQYQQATYAPNPTYLTMGTQRAFNAPMQNSYPITTPSAYESPQQQQYQSNMMGGGNMPGYGPLPQVSNNPTVP